MPPRIPLLQCLRVQTAQPPSTLYRAFSTTPTQHASTQTQRRKHRDPYAIAQAKAKKAANLSRQEVLKQERAATLGDPVRGLTTPFVESFDTGLSPEPASTTTHNRIRSSPDTDAPGPSTSKDSHLNFYLSKSELDAGITQSDWLLTPSEERQNAPQTSDYTIDTTPEERLANLEQDRSTAAEALRRIASLSLGSSKDRLRINKQRCIATFGRHSTDTSLPPRPASARSHPASELEKKERVGPDTGSSEVQIAILTAKIRTVSQFVETRGRTDRVNKRNLRLLVHRRQKLLQYLRRKERGGPRWQNLIETLGLTEGTWQGEISLGP